MTDIMKIRLLAMIDEEMKQVVGMISNETVWMHGSATEEESQMHMSNIADLEEYRDTLLRIRERTVEDDLNV